MVRKHRWWCGLLVALILILVCSSVAAAEAPGRLVASDANGDAGNSVTIDIRIENNPGIISAAVEIYYDTTKLELISTENKQMMPQSSFSQYYTSYPYCASWTDAYADGNMSDDGILMTLTFKILDDAKAGDTAVEVKFDPANMFDSDMKVQSFVSVDGVITIHNSAAGNEEEANGTENDTAKTPDTDTGKKNSYFAYSDLDPSGWYRQYVEYMLEKGYMNGMSESTFAPNGNVTRAQLVTILYRIAGSPRTTGMKNPFEDVKAGTWYTNAVIWAAENGIVNGVTATTFAPNNNITREQLATILYRYHGGLKTPNNHLGGFKDRDTISAYAKDAMNWAVGKGILNGSNGLLTPSASATRVQTAAMLTRYLESEVQIPVPTDPTIRDS